MLLSGFIKAFKNLIKSILVLSLLVLSSQCAFKSYVLKTEIRKNKRVYFKVPKKFEQKVFFADENIKSIGILYPDSSIIYIADSTSEFLPNFFNVLNSEPVKFTGENEEEDTTIITYRGSFNDRIWKEVLTKKNLVVGYWDVPEDRQELFDKALKKTYSKIK